MTPDDTTTDMNPADGLGLSLPTRGARSRVGARRLLFAGVAGACVLGVGLGLWARPGMNERRSTGAAQAAEAPMARHSATRGTTASRRCHR